MSFKIVDNVSEKANVLISGVASGVVDVASSVSHSVEEVVSSVSTGVGDVVHNVSCSVKRLITSPPDEEEIQKQIENTSHCESILPTPDDSGIGDGSFPSSIHQRPLITPMDTCTSSSSEVEGIGFSENYFSEPEIFELGSEASVEDIAIAIGKSKDMILNCKESTQRRRMLVQRLIQLRMALERVKEENEVASEGIQIKQGHQLVPLLSRLSPTSKQFCDKCTQVIWSVLHCTYRCCLCDYQCHGKCVKSKHIKCPSLKFAQNPLYILKICPEVGLDAQDYRCSHCRNSLTSMHPKSASCVGHTFAKGNVWGEPRLCDYTGKYFCPACHWNAKMTSPARVIRNWDFEEQFVSQQAKHFLTYVNSKPILSLEELNPHLFKFVEELHIVKKLRTELLLMKEYLRTCRMAQELRLLRMLEVRQHFVDSAKFYSMKDLMDLNDGILIPFLTSVHEEFTLHIKEKCETCRGKGFICELCNSDGVIFPFDDRVTVCKMCQASFHANCFASVSVCPRCIRQSSRRLKNQEEHGATNVNR